MNLLFPKSEFTDFLDSVYGKGKVMSDGIDLSMVTERCAPTATSVRWARTTSSKPRPTCVTISVATTSAGYRNTSSRTCSLTRPLQRLRQGCRHLPGQRIRLWSLIHVGSKLDPAIAEDVERKGRHKVLAADGRIVTVYSR